MKPSYERPSNFVEQEANLRKILNFLIQNKIIKN